MTRIFAPVLAVALSAAPAYAASDSEILLKFGLVGKWAVDCTAPPSLANPYQEFVPWAEREPTREIIAGDAQHDRTMALHDVIFIPPDRLRISFDQNGIAITIILVKEKNRIRPLESTTAKGDTSVSGGIVLANGEPTPWFQKCGD